MRASGVLQDATESAPQDEKRQPVRESRSLDAQPALNRVWALDFMQDTHYDARPFQTLNLIDEGNREAPRIECAAPSLPQPCAREESAD